MACLELPCCFLPFVRPFGFNLPDYLIAECWAPFALSFCVCLVSCLHHSPCCLVIRAFCQQKFIKLISVSWLVMSAPSALHVQPLNGPCVFLPRSWMIPCSTLLLRCIYLRYGPFMRIKDSPTHWRTAFGFKELFVESSVHRATSLLTHVYQFLVTFFTYMNSFGFGP